MRYADAAECCRQFREHFCRMPTPAQALTILFTVGAIVAVVVLTSMGILQDAADHITMNDHYTTDSHPWFGTEMAYEIDQFKQRWNP